MKIIFFGLGSIGLRHARLIKKNYNFELYAFRSDKNAKKNILGIKEIYDLKEIDNINPDIAFITNPTNKHLQYATYCAERGIHLFVEKPLSNNIKGLKEFVNVVKKSKVTTYTAYCLRFHSIIIWLKNYLRKNKPIHIMVNASSYLPTWRKNINHLKHYSAFKDKGGGIILEQSHEIDYLYYLFGDLKNIKLNSRKISNVTVDAEDFVDILLEFKNGIFGNIHMDFFSRLKKREIIINFINHTIKADLVNNKILVIKDNNERVIKFNIIRDDYFTSQLKYFFEHVGKKDIINNLDESQKVFKIIMKIKEGVKGK